jgi:hypothetical protein
MSPWAGRTNASAVTLALSALALSQTLEISSGVYSIPALGWLTVSLICCGMAIVLADTCHLRDTDWRLHLLLAGGIVWQLRSEFRDLPGIYLGNVDLAPFKAGVAINTLILVLAVTFRKTLAPVWFPAFILISTLLGWWVLTASPHPAIDVVVVHHDAIQALIHGHNPYAITFENIYGAGSPFYSASEIDRDRVLFGYPYPPLSLLFALPGALIFGDYRYAMLLALVGAAALIGYGRRDAVNKLAAVLFLTTPGIFFVLEQGWTEPVVVLLIAATVFAGRRSPKVSSVMGGLLLSVKQYLILAVPALWVLGRALGVRRFLAIVVTIAAVVTLPFFVWSPRAFVHSVVQVQLQEPFRKDSLSYLSLAAHAGWGEGSALWTVGAASAALAFTLSFSRRRARFPLMLAFTYLATFAFGQKAFANYYFLVSGALCCALGDLERGPAHEVELLARPPELSAPPSRIDGDSRNGEECGAVQAS